MKFDLFPKVSITKGKVCTKDVFVSVIESQEVKQTADLVANAAAQGKKELVAERKRTLPCVTWQASFEGNQRANEKAIPSGLFMLDIDHIPNIMAFTEEIVQPLLDNDHALAKKLGIDAIHITPSGEGIRFVAKCPLGMTTIEGCQKWLAEQLGIMSYDASVKDWARTSFLVPKEWFLLLDLEDLFEGEAVNVMNVDLSNTGTTEKKGKDDVVSTQQRTFSQEQKEFKYRGHLIAEIAAEWVKRHGEPQAGERHTYYYRLCTMFRYITDGDTGVMLAQLPDFGLGIAEREKEVEHATKRSMGSQIPYTFYKFLCEIGVIKVEKESKESAVKIDLTDYAPPTLGDKVPPLPPVFREFTSNCPADFVYPTVVALLPVLGTLATRLRATYLDGRVHTPSFISVIFAPQSAGKSFARDIVSTLCVDLRKHDEISVLKEKQYRAELRAKKNSDNQPEDPHAPYRIVQGIISVPRLLQRQEDACGVHQFSFVEEIDTLIKSNAGGSYAQKSDLYRQAFDNAEYGQDYISIDTFTGSVKLYYNILMLGTPKQLYKFFNDAENGLVSRCAFAEILNQEFASIPYFKPLSKSQQEAITRVLNRFEDMTYRRKNSQSEDYIIQPVVNIDKQMQPIRDVLAQWLEESRMQAILDNNISLDVFRRRAAVKAFRLGMICIALYEKKSLTKAVIKKICEFVKWFAQQDALMSVNTFGKMLQASQTNQQENTAKSESLFDSLPDTFDGADLIARCAKRGNTKRPTEIIYRWKKQGYIKPLEDGKFQKIKK